MTKFVTFCRDFSAQILGKFQGKFHCVNSGEREIPKPGPPPLHCQNYNFFFFLCYFSTGLYNKLNCDDFIIDHIVVTEVKVGYLRGMLTSSCHSNDYNGNNEVESVENTFTKNKVAFPARSQTLMLRRGGIFSSPLL